MGLLDWIGGWFVKKPKPTATPHIMASPGDRLGLIGLNKYPGCPLRGCVFDAENMMALAQAHGFAAANTRKLLDEEGTTANILDMLKWLAATPSGSRAMLWNSSHGVIVPQSITGVSALICATCPIDFDWSMEHMVTDKQYVDIFSRMAPGVRFNWGSDSCNSSQLDRRFNPHQTIPRAYPTPISFLNEITEQRRSGHVLHTAKSLIAGKLDVGFVSGCKVDQTSADTEVNGQPCGAFTWYFVEAFKASPASPLNALTARTLAKLKIDGYDQEPQADGPQDVKPFILV